MPQLPPPDPQDLFELADLRRIVETYLPAWKRACTAPDTDAIALHELAFGCSTRELLLFACAIKFAAANGKNVHVASGNAAGKSTHKFMPLYRERSGSPSKNANLTGKRVKLRRAS
jgi:hypothetical protein